MIGGAHNVEQQLFTDCLDNGLIVSNDRPVQRRGRDTANEQGDCRPQPGRAQGEEATRSSPFRYADV